MKTLFHIGEKIAGLGIWLAELVTIPLGLLVTLPQLPRYMRIRHM